MVETNVVDSVKVESKRKMLSRLVMVVTEREEPGSFILGQASSSIRWAVELWEGWESATAWTCEAFMLCVVCSNHELMASTRIFS